MECHKWVRRCGSHSVEEERRILLFLRMREGPFLLQFFDQVGIRVWEGLSAARRRGGARGVIRLLLVGLAARAAGGPFHRLRDGPRKPRPGRVIGLVLAQDVQGRFQGIKRRQLSPGGQADSKSALRGKKSNRDNNNKKEKGLASLLDKTVYMSGDWYILLLIMKYACKGRATESSKTSGFLGSGSL